MPPAVVIIGAGIIGGSIGILMTEMLLDGRASSMDIQALSLDRFAAGRLRAEANMF